MAEHNDPQEPTLPTKRKSDSDIQDLPSKIPKLDLKEPNPTANDDTSQLPNSSSSEPVNDDKDLQNDNDENQLQNDDEEEDRKGKGISRDDKGKGKMIVQEDDDDDGDDSDDDSDSDDDDDSDGSDFSDDPLTEVDLNNILPSRTRGRTASAGVRIAGDAGNAAAAHDDDDDDSDDSDA